MRIFHPRRYLNRIVNWYCISVFLVQCRFHHIKCVIGNNVRIWRCSVKSKKDGTIIIGDNCILKGAAFCFYGSGGRIELSERVTINAYSWARTKMFVKDSSCIFVSNDCLFSNRIDISTTDWHGIYDESGQLLNPEKDVHIGQHVWIGRKATVCKGVTIPDNSIVGQCSVVTKSFNETNILIAGNPAMIKKSGIRWK